MELYLGNSRGTVLGPYDKNEIRPQLRARQILSLGNADVYAVQARNLAQAHDKLKAELRKTEAK